MKRKLWAILLGLAMLPTSALPAMAEESAAPTVTNLYTLDFERADTSKSVSATDKGLFATWLPNGFDSSLMSIGNGGDRWTYGAVSDAPSNNGKALKFTSTAKPSAGNKYLEMKSTGMTDEYPSGDYAKISTGGSGAAVLSFDYYANGKGQFVRAGRVLSEGDGNIQEVESQNLIRIDNDGKLRLFATSGSDNPLGTVPINDNKWHTFKLVSTSDNKYEVIVDGAVILGFADNTVYKNANIKFRGWKELRFYNNAALNSGTIERYMDNISYDVMRNIDFTASAVSISHSNKDIDKYFSISGSAAPKIYAKPGLKVSDFVNGLAVKEYDLTNGTATVLDANGTDITSDTSKTMADAATVKVVTNTLGLVKEYPVVTATSTEPIVETINSGSPTIETTGGNDRLFAVDSRVEPVGGIAGKAADDYAIKLIPTTSTKDETTGDTTVADTLNTNGYLDYNLQKSSSLLEKANMPMTFEFSAYAEGKNGLADIEIIGKAGSVSNIRLEFGSGKVIDVPASQQVTSYKTGKWNRFAVTVYPNSMTYVLYVNGEKVYTKEIAADKASQYFQRIRLRTKYLDTTDMVLFDDVKLTYGAYDYTQAAPVFSALGNNFELGNDSVTLYPHSGVLVSDAIAMAKSNGFTYAKVYTDTTLATLADENAKFERGNVLVISDGAGMYGYYRAIRKWSLDTKAVKTDAGYTVTASGRYNTMQGSFDGLVIYIAQYDDTDNDRLIKVSTASPSTENSQELKTTLDVDSLENVKAFLWEAEDNVPLTAPAKVTAPAE